MAPQYENIISFVKPHEFKIITKKEDYSMLEQEKRVVLFECPKGHEMQIGHANKTTNQNFYEKNCQWKIFVLYVLV